MIMQQSLLGRQASCFISMNRSQVFQYLSVTMNMHVLNSYPISVTSGTARAKVPDVSDPVCRDLGTAVVSGLTGDPRDNLPYQPAAEINHFHDWQRADRCKSSGRAYGSAPKNTSCFARFHALFISEITHISWLNIFYIKQKRLSISTWPQFFSLLRLHVSGIRSWISNHSHSFAWDVHVITQTCSNFNDDISRFQLICP